jgi:RimK family alpha-L-glutamate ligase
MNIALLSYGTGWHVRDLQRAAGQLGHQATSIDWRGVQASVPHRSTLDGHEIVIVRTMPPGSLEQVVFRMDVLHVLQDRGVRVLNPPRALEVCVDKYLASARLEAAGLPTPPTAICQDAESAMAAFEELGRDVVVKPLFGSEGRGMLRIESGDLGWRVFRALERTQAVLYVQRYVPHPGWDLRVLVLGGQVLAAMRRHARSGWRTNVAQGGRAETISVTADEARLALAAAEAVGTTVAGVDLLPRPQGGYEILEVNAVPGWRALAPASGVDVATAILRHAASQAPAPTHPSRREGCGGAEV